MSPAPASGPLVEARDLRKTFGTFEAVKGIDIEVRPGELFGFLGPNGAGKSTTMRMVATVSTPTSGHLRVLGMDPTTHGPQVRARLGVCPQDDTLDNELSVRENLVVYGRFFGLSRAECRARADELLDYVSLADKRDNRVEALSGGMKRRLTIARSLVNRPDLLLLDEPTTGLDPQARHALWDQLYRLKHEGVTQILTTHYMDEAEQLCDRIVVIDGGVVVAQGTPRELIATYSTREVAELRFGATTPDAMTGHAAAVAGIGSKVEQLPDRLLLYVDDGDAALREVHARGLPTDTVLVRRSTLEDVFLHLTGRSLVD